MLTLLSLLIFSYITLSYSTTFTVVNNVFNYNQFKANLTVNTVATYIFNTPIKYIPLDGESQPYYTIQLNAGILGANESVSIYDGDNSYNSTLLSKLTSSFPFTSITGKSTSSITVVYSIGNVKSNYVLTFSIFYGQGILPICSEIDAANALTISQGNRDVCYVTKNLATNYEWRARFLSYQLSNPSDSLRVLGKNGEDIMTGSNRLLDYVISKDVFAIFYKRSTLSTGTPLFVLNLRSTPICALITNSTDFIVDSMQNTCWNFSNSASGQWNISTSNLTLSSGDYLSSPNVQSMCNATNNNTCSFNFIGNGTILYNFGNLSSFNIKNEKPMPFNAEFTADIDYSSGKYWSIVIIVGVCILATFLFILSFLYSYLCKSKNNDQRKSLHTQQLLVDESDA